MSTIDTRLFPVVVQHPVAHDVPDRVQLWCMAMSTLLDAGRPFAMVALRDPAEDSEPPEAKRERAVWMKENASRYAAVCRGVWRVDPDPARRAATEERLARMSAGTGIPFALAPDEATAIEAAEAACRRADEAGLRALFDRFVAAMQVRDFDAVAALLAPGFRYSEPGSPEMDAAALLAREQAAGVNQPRTTATYDLRRVQPNENDAAVSGMMRFTTRLCLQGSERTFEGSGSFEAAFQRVGPGWLFARVEYGAVVIYKDGKEVDVAQALAELHSPVVG